MIVHAQRAQHHGLFYAPGLSEDDTGHVVAPAGTLYVRGRAQALPAYRPLVGSAPFRLWVEQTATGADYLLDLTLAATPVVFDADVGALLVAWRDVVGDELHVLRHIDA